MNLILPFPPSVNAYWRHVTLKTARGVVNRTMLSKRARQYRTDALAAIWTQHKVGKPIDYHVKVVMDFYPPTARKFDLDNYNKAPLDALTHARVWDDDDLVYDLHCIKHEKREGGALVVSIEPIG